MLVFCDLVIIKYNIKTKCIDIEVNHINAFYELITNFIQ
jgi:hypothetical protein